ncbi:MAG: hypothetical protein HY278_08590, partial [candidate division NC10 bacterium]|nr:hypothetical protein [candidate division NC10 bacterium]
MTGRIRLWLLAALVGTVLVGCAYLIDLVPEEKNPRLASRSVTEEILRTLLERESKVTSLKAMLDLTVWYGGK